MGVSLFFMCFLGGLLNFVLSEVGATHEVGGRHAFFAGELDLVEVDVAVEDCDFQYLFAIADECACWVGWGAEFFADFVDFHVCGITIGVSKFEPCCWIWGESAYEVAYGFGCRVEVDSAGFFEDFWGRFEFAFRLWHRGEVAGFDLVDGLEDEVGAEVH